MKSAWKPSASWSRRNSPRSAPGAADLGEFARIETAFAAPDFADLPEVSRKLEAAQAADAELALFVEHNLFRHKVKGYAALTLSLKGIGATPGDATAAQMRVVADLAEKYSLDELHVSHKQNSFCPMCGATMMRRKFSPS